MPSMEEDAPSGVLDAARLAEEAPKLVRSASRATEGLATEIQSCDGGRRPRSCAWKLRGPELGVLEAYMLVIWGISAGAGDTALALQARDTVYSIQLLRDIIEYGRLQSSLSSQSTDLLPALKGCGWNLSLPLFASSKPRRRIMKGIKVVNQETLKIGHLLEKGAGASSNLPKPLVPGSGMQNLQRVVFGRDKESDDIVQMLIQPCRKPAPEMMAICLLGMVGIGKTTLARMVFDDARVGKRFDAKCWVTVSTASNKMELTAEILRSAQPPWGGSPEKMVNLQMIQSELRRFVASKMCLIVIDDVCNSTDEFLQDILTALQSANIGSRILATSRMNTVPHMLGASQVYTLNPLNSDDCWALLKEHAFPSDHQHVYPDLQQIGEQIAAILNGSPLAAKLVGALLGDTRSKDHWIKILDAGLQDNTLFTARRLSYKYLPVHLKRCFAYCSLFPQNYKFDPAHLARLWIAEGFVEPQGKPEKRMEDIAREYFDQLLSRSFFQEIKLGPKTYYLVHDLLHDLAKSVAAEDCFCIEDGMNCDIPSTVCHFSVTMNSLSGLTSFRRLEKLRTLLIRPSLPSSSSCFQEDFAVNLRSILEKAKHLRVLDLSGYNSKELPCCIDKLLHLRYLSIHGSIQRLPESVGKLLHLQTLCFTGKCYLEKLPASISMLVNLRHLIVETKYTAELVGIGQLANLQGSLELHVEKREGCKLEELKNINGLRGLLNIKGLENVSSYEEACKAELNKKPYLHSLNLEWSSASRNNSLPADAKVLEGLQPHQAAEIQLRGDLDGRMLGLELGLIKTYVLRMVKRGRDLEDVIESNLVATRGKARRRRSKLECGWKRLIGGEAPFSSNAIRIIRELSVLSGRLGLLLDKGARLSSSPQLPLPPGSGKRTVVFGRDKELDEIVQPCGKAAEPEMTVSIFGAGGIGKMKLAQMVLNDARVRQHFDVICWVSVSPSSNKMEIAAEILRSAQPSWGGSAEKMVDFRMLKSESSTNQSVAMQHVMEEICGLEIWDKGQLSAATKNLSWSIEQTPYSIQADTVCCISVSRCQSESSSHNGYASSDGGGSRRRSNGKQLHYPSHAHMDPGDVLLVLPGPVTQLEDIFRKCEVTFGPDYKEMLLQAFSDNSDTLSSFFYELDIPEILRGSTRTLMDHSERTEELIIMLKINTKVLCLMQEQFCEQSRPFDELKIGYFALFAKCRIQKLLEIALCLSETVWSHTHICPMLLAYEALTDVLPFIQQFPSSVSADFFSSILCNMRVAFRRLIDHIKDFIQSNREKHQGAAIHPMTCFLICTMRSFSSHRNLVQSTLAPNGNSNSFGHLLYEVITCWKSVLTEHSKMYCTDLLWRYIFLLNNTEHFNRMTDGLLGELLSDRQIIEQHDDDFKLLFKNWIESYTKEACTPAKSCLTRNNWWGSPRPSLAAFTSKFNKTFDRQKTWKIPDLVLRQELKDRVQDCLLSDYRRSVENYSSSGLFCSCFEISSARDIYTPESLQTTVQGLYEA